MDIVYKQTKKIDMSKIFNLYSILGWSSYTDKKDELDKLFDNSLYVLSAWHDDELAGFVRVVGDGLSIIYIQDLVVGPKYWGNKIGTNLMNKIFNKYQDVRQIVLLTDDDEKTKKFYESVGMKNVQEIKALAYIKHNS